MAWEKGIQVPFPFFVFAWHWKTDLNFAFCFSFSTRLEKRFWTSYFVFASLWKTDMNFSFRFSFSHHFEKRIWISFFVFALLWKTDLNFVSRFLITLKNRSEFRLSFLHNHLKPRPPPWKVSFLSSFPGYNKLLHHKLLNNWATWTGKNKTRLVNFSYKWHKKCVRDLNKTGLS